MMNAEPNPTDRAPGEGFLVLWVGGGDVEDVSVQDSLRAAAVRVEDAPLDGLTERAIRRAPDLIVLSGAAARAPDSIVAGLAGTHPGTLIPVVTLGPAAAARPKARSRFGLVARLDRTEASEALAKRLTTLLRALSRRPARWRVKASLDELPALARRTAEAGRAGLLAATDGGAVATDAQGVVAPDPGLLVAALTGTFEPELSLYERAPGRVRVLNEPPVDAGPSEARSVEGVRVVVIDEVLDCAERLARRCRAAGAEVRATGIVPSAIEASRSFDPTLIVVSAPALLDSALTPLWLDARLSVASLLVLEGGALDAPPEALLPTIVRMCAPEVSLRTRLVEGEALAERLESLGPTRWLKILGRCQHDATFRVFAAAGRGRVDLSGGKIQGASFHPSDPRTGAMGGRAAVEAILSLRFGRVLVGPPEELGKLEGMTRRRKMSVVRRVAPADLADADGRQSTEKGASDVARPASSAPKIVVPKPGAFVVPSPRIARDDAAPEEDLELHSYASLDEAPEDGWDTVSYPAAQMEKLRAQLLRMEEEGEGFTGANRDFVSAGDDSTRREGAVDPDQLAKPDLPPPEPPPARVPSGEASPAKSASPAADVLRPLPPPLPRPGAPRSSDSTASAPPARATAAADEADGPMRAKPSTYLELTDSDGGEPASAGPDNGRDRALPASPSSDRPAPEPLEPGAAPSETAPRSKSGFLWFAVGLAGALGLAVYAASQLGGEEERAGEGAARATDEAPRVGAASLDPGGPEASEAETERDDPAVGGARSDQAPPEVGAQASPERAAGGGGGYAEQGRETTTSAGEPTTGAQPRAGVAENVPVRGGGASPSGEESDLSTRSIVWLVRESLAAARARDYPRSEVLAREALSRSPEHPRAAYRLAVSLYRQQQLEEALTWAERATAWDRESPLPIALQGDIHMRSGRFVRAARAYRDALAVDPDFAPAHRQLARLRERGVVPE